MRVSSSVTGENNLSWSKSVDVTELHLKYRQVVVWLEFTIPEMYFEKTQQFGLVFKEQKIKRDKGGETGSLAFWSE